MAEMLKAPKQDKSLFPTRCLFGRIYPSDSHGDGFLKLDVAHDMQEAPLSEVFSA